MKSNILIPIFVLFINLGAYAQIDRTKPPVAGPAPEIQIGTPASFELKNGLKVFVVENRKLPRVAFNLVLDIEAVKEGEKAGYASMAGDLMRTGTKTRSKAQIDEEVDFIGATLNTSSGGIYASSLTKHSQQLLELMTDVLYNPTFPQDEFDKLKKQMLSSLAAQKDDPGSISSNVQKVVMYGQNHPYGELTTEESINNITIDDCRNYYNTHFSPKISYLVIVGDINVKEAKKTVKKYFKSWPAKDIKLEKFESVPGPAATSVALVDRSNSVQSNISITYPIDLKKGSPDEIKMRVLNQILGAASDSRLEKQIREKKAYTYYARSTYSSDMIVGNFKAFSEVRNEVTDSAIYEFVNELRKIVDQRVSEDELKRAKAQIMGSFSRSLESPQTIANFALNIKRYNLPADYYATYLQKVDAVTIDDIQATAKKYIKPENAHIVVVGKGSEIADKLGQFGSVTYYDIYGNSYVPKKSEIPAGLTSAKVLDDFLASIGGEEKVRSIHDIKMKFNTEMQGQQLEITISGKNPDKQKTSVTMNGMAVMTSIVNGDNASMSQMGQTMPVDEDRKKDLAFEAAIVSEIAIKDMGLEAKLIGAESIEGKTAYAIEITKPSGNKTTYFYDAETGLKVRTSETINTPQGDMVQETDLTSYKDVAGVKFPFQIALPMGPMKMIAIAESIELNTGIADSEFAVQ
jgi:zinc protease